MNDENEKSAVEKSWESFGLWICLGLVIFAAPMSYEALAPTLKPLLNDIYSATTAKFLDGVFKVLLWPICFFAMRASMITAMSYAALWGGSRALGFA